jgi:hypothetical protein
LRGIPISQIREETRAELADVIGRLATRLTDLGYGDLNPDDPAAAGLDQWLDKQLTTLTTKGEPRKRRPAATEALLRHVAALYEHAVSHGDKTPVKYVEEHLRAAGEPRLSAVGGRVQVRQWVRRARERGYLTVPPTRGEG